MMDNNYQMCYKLYSFTFMHLNKDLFAFSFSGLSETLTYCRPRAKHAPLKKSILCQAFLIRCTPFDARVVLPSALLLFSYYI